MLAAFLDGNAADLTIIAKQAGLPDSVQNHVSTCWGHGQAGKGGAKASGKEGRLVYSYDNAMIALRHCPTQALERLLQDRGVTLERLRDAIEAMPRPDA